WRERAEPPLDDRGHRRFEWRADREQRARAQVGGPDTKTALVEAGLLASTRREELPGHRIVDGARERHAVAQHADRNGEAGYAAAEVVGTVHRIEDPSEPSALVVPARRQALLAQDTVGRKRAGDLGLEPALDCHVRVGHHGFVVFPGELGALKVITRRLP